MTFNAAALLLLILGLALIGWLAGRARSALLAGRSGAKLHSRPQYHGWYVALWLFAPAAIFLAVWTSVSPALVTNQVLATGAELGADLRAIAIVQSMRVVIVAVGLPAGLAAVGLTGDGAPRPVPVMSVAHIDEWAILIAVSVAGAIAAHRFRLPGGLLFGAMFASAALHGSGFIHAVVPYWAANTAMVALGAVVGARFTNTPLRMLLHYITAALERLIAEFGAIPSAFPEGSNWMLRLN